jgi:hypothetical protein
MKWKKKKEEKRFLNARKGDLLCAPFQCDFCWYANIHHGEANDWYPSDARKLAYIRRVNLDVFWSREPSTVASTHNTITRARKSSEELGFDPIKISLGPWPIADTCGFQVAIEMLKHSQGKGKNDNAYIQYDSIRKARSAYSNVFEGGPIRCLDNRKLRTEKGQMLSFVKGPTDSKLFTMFMLGCEKRMGRFVKQDIGISLPVLQSILDIYDEELKNPAVSFERKRMVIMSGAAFVILWAGALRGGEVFMIEASELVKRRNDGKDDTRCGHCVIPLMGRFKQESGERNLLIVLANKTKGGLNVRYWVDLLVKLLMAENKGNDIGPALCNEDGFMLEKWKLNGELHSILNKVQDLNASLIPVGITIDEKYNVYRSFRRGATTRAKEQGVDEATIEMNNRWRKWQNKQGSLPNLPMTQLYVEISQALMTKLRFSSSL